MSHPVNQPVSRGGSHRQTLYAWLALLTWVSLLASSFVISAEMVRHASPVVSTGLRFMIASLIMLPLVAGQLKRYASVAAIARYSFTSLFMVLFFLGLFESLKTTTALNTAVIYTLVPIFSVAIAWLALRNSTAWLPLLGFILGSAGAVWVLLASRGQSLQLHSGDLICLLACVSLALHVVLARKWGHLMPAPVGAFWILFCGSLMLLPFLLLGEGLAQVQWHDIAFWQPLLYLTVFTTVITAVLQQYLVRAVGPKKLLAFTYLVPTLVVLWQQGAGIFFSLLILPGIALTLLALLLITTRPEEVQQEATTV
ncbi:DMT family transporter [Marinobacterium jannaschii]|uniref:DMT family transporter n=1 Tax=Marinobacterium jannaschii TaxID=64970 RepID=UPI000A034FB7|nr:DMT family transporter [Marinobacterium jannaschii]